MKELSIEEKAKAYDEALNRCREFYETLGNAKLKKEVEEIFPQLKESEDEKIRKALVEMVHDTTGDELWIDYNVHKEEALAWLEKQCEQKPVYNGKHKLLTVERAKEMSPFMRSGFEHNPAETEKGAKGNEMEIPNSAWSEEDEQTFIKSVEALEDFGKFELADWLKEHKNRVHPQPKQEWSEEDKKRISSILLSVKYCKEQYPNLREYQCDIDWLKSLRPHNTWKPSEEMLKALYKAIPENVMEMSEDEMLLDKLYQGLKYGKVLSEN